MALARAHRLSSGYMISLVCKKGVCVKTPFFRVVYLPAQKKVSQVVVVVSKKYDKRAVARNLIRRRIIGEIEKVGFPQTPLLIVVFPYENARTMSVDDLNASLVGVWKKTIYKKNIKKEIKPLN